MKLPDTVEIKLRDQDAIVLPRIALVKKGQMTIHYHCDGKLIGETTFPYRPETYADWFRSMAEALSEATPSSRNGPIDYSEFRKIAERAKQRGLITAGHMTYFTKPVADFIASYASSCRTT